MLQKTEITQLLHNTLSAKFPMARQGGPSGDITFDETMKMDRVDGTKAGYARNIKHLVQFLRRRRPDLVGENNDLDLPNVPVEELKAFLDHVKIKRKNVRHDGIFSDPVDKINDKFVLNSTEHVSGYRSALKWFYEEKNVDFPAHLNKQISRFTVGFKRVKNQRKQDGEEEADEGKAPMQFNAYEWLAKTALSSTTDFMTSVFSWVYLLLAWNLIARGKNVGKVMFEHIGWEDDALTLRMFVKKHDQEGKDVRPKHVFANPIKPYICPILALGIYVFTMGPRRPGSKNLVFGNECAMARFSKWLGRILRNFASALKAMGVRIDVVGTHSFRKGTATHLMGLRFHSHKWT